jgi:peptide/nickel transport system permease protein
MGKVDLFVQRLNDVLQALPTLIMAMAVVAALGASMLNVIIAIALVNIPVSLRVMRGSVISIREADHVMAARAIGCSHVRLALVHIFPNCLAPFIVILTAKLGAVILVEAALSFLGLGVSESTPSWGGMLSRFGAEFARVSPWLVLSPGVAISITVIAFNLFGDAIRDVLDPKLRGV